MNPDDGGAEMVTFDTPSGGAVFSVGSITWPASICVGCGLDDHEERDLPLSRLSAPGTG